MLCPLGLSINLRDTRKAVLDLLAVRASHLLSGFAIAEEDQRRPKLDAKTATQPLAGSIFNRDMLNIGMLSQFLLEHWSQGLAVRTPTGSKLQHHWSWHLIHIVSGQSVHRSLIRPSPPSRPDERAPWTRPPASYSTEHAKAGTSGVGLGQPSPLDDQRSLHSPTVTVEEVWMNVAMRPRSVREDPLHSATAQFRNAANTELSLDVFAMAFHRVHADPESIGNLLRSEPMTDMAKDF